MGMTGQIQRVAVRVVLKGLFVFPGILISLTQCKMKMPPFLRYSIRISNMLLH